LPGDPRHDAALKKESMPPALDGKIDNADGRRRNGTNRDSCNSGRTTITHLHTCLSCPPH
jgi:hypothetical protein